MGALHTPERGHDVIAALAVIPPVAATTVAVSPHNPDCELLEAWNRRQTALAVIESRGRFYGTDRHSPAEGDAHNDAEMGVYNLPAKTLHGVLAKLWVGLAHLGGQIVNEEGRARSDTVRRADLPEVETFARDFDFGEELVFQAIRDLTGIIRSRHKAG